MKSEILKTALCIALLQFWATPACKAQSGCDFTASTIEGETLCYTVLDSNQHTVSVTGVPDEEYEGTLTIPDTVSDGGIVWTVVSIGDSAFFRQYDITDVVIPNTIDYIGKEAFYCCGIEEGLNVPPGTDSIGARAFQFINNIVYQGSASGSPWGALAVNAYLEDSLFYSDNTKRKLLSCFGNITHVIVPPETDSLGPYALNQNGTLRTVELSEGLEYIGKLTFPSTSAVLLDVEIPKTVTCIDDMAFYSANVRSVIINDAPCSIGWSAFGYCNYLQHIDLGDSVRTIASAAFQCSRGLTEITIPESVTSIGDSLFCFSWNIEYATLPSTLDTIKFSTFRGCWKLREITIPATTCHLEGLAFSECIKLWEIISLNPVPPTAEDDSFFECNANARLYVPCGSAQAYSSDPHWSYFQDIVEDCDAIDQAADNHVAVFPNPAADRLTIQAGNGCHGVELVNMAGQTVVSSQTRDGRAVIDVSGLSRGSYIVRILTPDGPAVQKVMLQ